MASPWLKSLSRWESSRLDFWGLTQWSCRVESWFRRRRKMPWFAPAWTSGSINSRELAWPELTDGTGVTGKVWTARPASVSGITVSQETLTISPYDLTTAKSLQATWDGTSSPSVSFTAGTQALSAASAVKVIATLSWTGNRSSRQQTRSVVTVISRGGISKSVLP